jgi:hypothetical protein
MCTIYENKVKWVISKDFIMKIKKSLETDSDEIAGALLFEDSCKGDVCNKKSTEFKINNGNGSSVLTPHGIINFHTHPRSAYNGQGAVYGWPSGEDMAQTIVFAKKNNLIHIVFTLEGAYIIHVKKTIAEKDNKILEKIIKRTHVFRSSNQSKQYSDFKKFLGNVIITNRKTTVNLWIDLINKLSLKTIYELHNKHFDKQLSVPDDNDIIFDISLVKMTNNLTFSANFVEEACHLKSFRGKS